MNKISKKIVALATMAAFVLTLVPAAAFGAVGSTVSVDKSEITIDGSTGIAETTVTANIDASDIGVNYLVWVEKDGVQYRYADYAEVDGTTYNAASDSGVWSGVAILDDKNAGKYQVTVKLPEAGDYTVCVGTNLNNAASLSQVTKLASTALTVKAAATEVTAIDNFSITVQSPDTVSDNQITLNTPNSIRKAAVVADVTAGYVDGKTDGVSSEGTVITIDNGNNAAKGVYVFAAGSEEEIDEVTVNANEQIKFDVKAMSGAKPGKYTITLSAGEYSTDLIVVVADNSEVATIEAVDTDAEYVSTTTPDFAGVAEVVFKDTKGNVKAAPAGITVGNTSNYMMVSQPDGVTLDVKNFGLEKIDDTDNYKLTYNGTLTAGKYIVRIALDNSSYVELPFNAAKVGDTVALEIVTDNNVETIVSGGTVEGTVYAVDANGIKTRAKRADVKLGFTNSSAVILDKSDVSLSSNGYFKVTAKDAEKYYGSKITLFAFDEQAKVQATKELTVVDGLSNYTLAFDNEAGTVAKDNIVEVSVVDENGKNVEVSGYAYAYVESSSNENAKIDVSFNDNNVKNGKVDLTVYSTEETTADIVVAIKDKNSKAIYANTLKYVVGEQDIPVDTTVVMTIGSSDFVINDEVITKEDSAPYVANDRTYVPFRALGEALGAEVVWDNDARTVTYTLGNTEVVMTIGETTYTVNGDEKTMDVAPEITGDRTYVPVRFVGEALGFKVVALSATDGTTSSVVFQK